MSKQTAEEIKTQEGTGAGTGAQDGAGKEVTLIPMPEGFKVWETHYFDPTEIKIDYTANGRRFGVKADKVAAMREDFLNPNIGQLQECGVYWNELEGVFQLVYGYHRGAAAVGITTDGVGPDEVDGKQGVCLLRCVITPAGNAVEAMGFNLAENSPRTKSDLTPMDKAYSVERMLAAGYNQKDIAARLGYSKAMVSLLKNLPEFPLKVQKAIDAGKITQAAAFELAADKDNPEELQRKADELIAAAGDGGRVGTGSVRASKRNESDGDGDNGDGGDGTGGEGGEGGEGTKPARAPKTARSLKEIMAFFRDYSDADKGAVLTPSQKVLGIMLKFAEGKIKEKAACKQIDKEFGAGE